MLKLKVTQLPVPAARAVNPAHLLQAEGLHCKIYPAIHQRQYLTIAVLTLLLAALLVLVLLLQEEERKWQIFSAGLILGLTALGLLALGRIATCKIYFIQPGHAFPTIDKFQIDETVAVSRVQRAKGSLLGTEYDFHFVVRETEPNVSNRLRRYGGSDGESQVLEYSLAEQRLVALLAARVFDPLRSKAARIVLSGSSDERRDLWPVVRLIVGRVLFRRPKTGPQRRFSGEESKLPESKGANPYLTYKLHLVPLTLWLLMVALVIVLPSFYQSGDERKFVAAALTPVPLFWVIYVLSFNKKAIARWKRWLKECGQRPLGGLPLYLFVPHNEPLYQWEELDEHDFQVHLDEYVMETSALFNIVLGTFTVTALTMIRFLI